MGINFPSRPPVGQKFPDPPLPNSPQWQWNGSAWVQISGGGGGGSGAASGITFAPGGNVAATDVQAAILELDTEKAALASPTFTGDPKAPTPGAGDNDTSIATTAFVSNAVAGVATVPPATIAPIMDSVAAVGVATKYAREDHVHPSDTSRAALTQVVRYDAAQTLTASQKAQARANIDVLKKNYIINGAMMVSQENGSTAGTTLGYYPVDMFVYGGTAGVGAASAYQIVTGTSGGSPNRLRIGVNTADTTVDAGDLRTIQHAVEGLRAADLRITSTKIITLQFGVKAPAGTYCVAFRNAATDRSYVAEYVIAAGEANTDVLKSVSLQMDSSGTWAIDNTAGIYITWALICGSTYRTTAGVWTAGNFMGSPNQFNFFGTAGNTFELFDVGLYEGSVAPAFQVPDYASELLLCMRYWQSFSSAGVSYPVSATTASVVINIPYFTPMRAVPTAIVPWTDATYNNGALTATTWQLVTPGIAVATKSAGAFTVSVSAGYGNVTALMYGMTLSSVPTAVNNGASFAPAKMNARL
jgi:hypothetical protein